MEAKRSAESSGYAPAKRYTETPFGGDDRRFVEPSLLNASSRSDHAPFLRERPVFRADPNGIFRTRLPPGKTITALEKSLYFELFSEKRFYPLPSLSWNRPSIRHIPRSRRSCGGEVPAAEFPPCATLPADRRIPGNCGSSRFRASRPFGERSRATFRTGAIPNGL